MKHDYNDVKILKLTSCTRNVLTHFSIEVVVLFLDPIQLVLNFTL